MTANTTTNNTTVVTALTSGGTYCCGSSVNPCWSGNMSRVYR